MDPAHWPYLADRITAHLQGIRLSQRELPGGEPALEPSLAQELEQAAEHYSALIAARLSQPVADAAVEAVEADYQRIDAGVCLSGGQPGAQTRGSAGAGGCSRLRAIPRAIR
ncbi:MAG: hypothetical protein R6W74_02685 [Nitrosomonas halophila]